MSDDALELLSDCGHPDCAELHGAMIGDYGWDPNLIIHPLIDHDNLRIKVTVAGFEIHLQDKDGRIVSSTPDVGDESNRIIKLLRAKRQPQIPPTIEPILKHELEGTRYE